jgi:hypothetical protein
MLTYNLSVPLGSNSTIQTYNYIAGLVVGSSIFKHSKNILVRKQSRFTFTYYVTRFYCIGVVIHDRRIGSRICEQYLNLVLHQFKKMLFFLILHIKAL